MKKIITFIIALAVISSLFCSCGKKADKPASEETTSQQTTESKTIETEPKSSDKSSEVSSTKSTTKAAKKSDASTEKAKADIFSEYKKIIDNNKYDYTETLGRKDIPQYGFYDFNKDGLPELLVWDIRLCSASYRKISVYKYNAGTEKMENVGEMGDFEGHATIGESAEKDGINILIRDSGQDCITKYTLKNNKIISEVIRTKESESSEEWIELSDSPDYYSGKMIKTVSDDYSLLEATIKK